jgi:hypothetical protein
MNHTKLNDFPDLEHRMTVKELKVMFAESILNGECLSS